MLVPIYINDRGPFQFVVDKAAGKKIGEMEVQSIGIVGGHQLTSSEDVAMSPNDVAVSIRAHLCQLLRRPDRLHNR